MPIIWGRHTSFRNSSINFINILNILYYFNHIFIYYVYYVYIKVSFFHCVSPYDESLSCGGMSISANSSVAVGPPGAVGAGGPAGDDGGVAGPGGGGMVASSGPVCFNSSGNSSAVSVFDFCKYQHKTTIKKFIITFLTLLNQEKATPSQLWHKPSTYMTEMTQYDTGFFLE